MSKTLDQYTPDERQQMIGRWATWSPDTDTAELVVIDRVHSGRHFVGCGIPGGDYLEIPRHRLGNVTPRLDLPPAWTPDGQPVPMTGQYENVGPDFPDTEDMPDLPDGTLVFRHCTEWEEA